MPYQSEQGYENIFQLNIILIPLLYLKKIIQAYLNYSWVFYEMRNILSKNYRSSYKCGNLI